MEAVAQEHRLHAGDTTNAQLLPAQNPAVYMGGIEEHLRICENEAKFAPGVDNNALLTRAKWLFSELPQSSPAAFPKITTNIYPEQVRIGEGDKVLELNGKDPDIMYQDPLRPLARWAFMTRMPYEEIEALILVPYIRELYDRTPSILERTRLWMHVALYNVDYYGYHRRYKPEAEWQWQAMIHRLQLDGRQNRLPGIPPIQLGERRHTLSLYHWPSIDIHSRSHPYSFS